MTLIKSLKFWKNLAGIFFDNENKNHLQFLKRVAIFFLKLIFNNEVENAMSVSEMKVGDIATVLEVPEGGIRDQLLRFGIAPGAKVRCHARLPLGPVVLKFGGQEIALGREVAKGVKICCGKKDR